MSKKSIFRKKSIEQLSSPEQLDQLMQVTTTKGWIALLTLCVLLAGTVFWGFTGRVPTRVQGTGVIIKTGGIYDVMPLGSGQVMSLSVDTGDQVEQGQVIAHISQPALQNQIDQAEAQLRELRDRHRRLQRFEDKDTQLQIELVKQQRENYKSSIGDTKERIAWLTEKVSSQEDLLEEGLITEQALLSTRQQLQSAQQRVAQLRSELKQTTIRKLTSQNQREQDLSRSRSQIEELELEVAQLNEQLKTDSEITSPYAGRILEVLTKPGDVVRRGQAVARLDRTGRSAKDLQAVLYIPGMDGKKVQSGMEVRVSPTTVKKEEFGSIKASVTRVSNYPATPAGMERVLKNSQLVRTLTAQSAPYEMYAALKLDSSTFSGYRWSSSEGPQTRIQSGTMCTATVTVEERRPAEMVMPFLKEFFGV